MKSRWLFFFIVLLVLPIISGSSFYIPKDTNYSIKFNCEIDGAVCEPTATCNVSIDNPNTSILVDNQAASFISNGRYNYSLNSSQNAILGEDYKMDIVCYDALVNGSQTVYYGINPSGIRPSEQRTDTITRSIYFVFVLGIILFIAFLFVNTSPPVKWTFFIFSIIFFLVGLNIIFISLQEEIVNPKLITFFSAFTAISWYFYWFAGGILALMWILSFMNTMIYKNNLKNAQRYGLA